MLHPLASLWRHPCHVRFYDAHAVSGHVALHAEEAEALMTRRRFASVDAAAVYLRYWVCEPAARAALRAALQRCGAPLPAAHGDAESWLRALAMRLATGSVVVIEESRRTAAPARLVAPAASAPDAALDALPPLSTVTVVAASPAAQEPAAPEAAQALAQAEEQEQAPAIEALLTPAAAADQDAQARTLEQAAWDGTPFCAVCEAARRAALAQKPETRARTQDPETRNIPQQLAQAQGLEQATRHGTPFCEICEAARSAASDHLHLHNTVMSQQHPDKSSAN